MKDSILKAAVQVLVESGLTGWTVDSVAHKAGCAKGLVNYHYRSKTDLLRQAAESLCGLRWHSRIEATSQTKAGAATGAALDRLWAALLGEVQSGRFAAWLSLVSASEPLRTAAANPSDQVRKLVSALGARFGAGDRLLSQAGTIEAGLDGLQLRLLMGARPPEVEEDYTRFWLAVIEG